MSRVKIEAWRDAPPASKGEQEPDRDTTAGQLLTDLRQQPGRWACVGRGVPLRWWFGREASALTFLARKHLVEYKQVASDEGGWTAGDVWARALTPDERESCRDVLAAT